MLKLFTEEELTSCRSRGLLPFECLHCHKVFYGIKNEIQKCIRRLKRGIRPTKSYVYCSRDCYTANNSKNSMFKSCCECGKLVWWAPHRSKKNKSDRTFCNQSCFAIYNNKHKTWGTRRSKLEGWVAEQLAIRYPALTCNCNKLIDCMEFDFFFPTLNLAIELNGVTHYRPIYGKDQFVRRLSKDAEKQRYCKLTGLFLLTLDVSQQMRFTPTTSYGFWMTIVSAIDHCTAEMGWPTGYDPASPASQAGTLPIELQPPLSLPVSCQ